MTGRWRPGPGLATLIAGGVLLMPGSGLAHPMGNFSISHYTGLQLESRQIELRYLIDMAEIPTFQELQEHGIVPEAGHSSLDGYLARKAESLEKGLRLEVNGARLALETSARDVLFTPGAGGLPTMKLGIVYRATLDGTTASGWYHVHYSDENFPERAGWKEVVASAQPGIVLGTSSVPQQDRSRQLTDYPTDMLNSPPQTLEARLDFMVAQPIGQPVERTAARSERAAPASPPTPAQSSATEDRIAPPVAQKARVSAPVTASVPSPSVLSASELNPSELSPSQQSSAERSIVARTLSPSAFGSSVLGATPANRTELVLQPNRRAARRDAFSDLIGVEPTGVGVFLFAAMVAATLGAFHALEPGHGKTVVAAYLVGARGTAWHACVLGLVVTASHTAGVYLLGGVTLYASRYVVPERLYPWLGAISGLTIAGLGFVLFLRRYAGGEPPRRHEHAHDHHDHGVTDHSHLHVEHGHAHDWHHHHLPARDGVPSMRELLALGITGGIVPCPAALVVLLSAVALRRVGFGLLLIVAFSVGLAAVLVAIGILMVHAARLMARFQAEGPLITRWLPLTSSAVITLLGMAIAVQALVGAGILQVRF